jgi:hypothetical protein
VERKPLRRSLADPGKLRQLGDQSIDRPGLHRAWWRR